MRPARAAAAAVVVLAVVLVAVLVGLLRAPGPATAPAAPTTSAHAASAPAPTSSSGLRVVALRSLPREAQQTVALIDDGGPFPYAQDGVTFGNNERLLPAHPRGWYREYTVPTPGAGDRGPRRIVTGDHDRLLYYTADHYASFVEVSR